MIPETELRQDASLGTKIRQYLQLRNELIDRSADLKAEIDRCDQKDIAYTLNGIVYRLSKTYGNDGNRLPISVEELNHIVEE